MADDFFIGREEEFRVLEHYILRPTASVHNPRFAYIWGDEEVGKSTFIDRFSSLMLQESDPVWSFAPKWNDDIKGAKAVCKAFIDSAEINLGDYRAQLEFIKTHEPPDDSDSEDAVSKYWADAILDFFQKIRGKSHATEGLKLAIFLDDFPELDEPSQQVIADLIGGLCKGIGHKLKMSIIITGKTENPLMGAIQRDWKSSLMSALKINLKPLSYEETVRWLESHDIDHSLILRIYQETAGIPGKIIEFTQKKDFQDKNSEEWYLRGKQILKNFNDYQRKWLKWAAVLKTCSDETLACFTHGAEINEAMHWVRANCPNVFFREDIDYLLNPQIRRSILAYIQREEPQLHDKATDKLKVFLNVRNTIPNSQHRRLLSLLSELNFFNEDLIKKAFAGEIEIEVMKLLENKPVFFRKEGNNYRIASNVRTAISEYNNLIKPDHGNVRSKVIPFWEEKKRQLRTEIKTTDKGLKETESRATSLTKSIMKIEEELNSLKGRLKARKQQQRTVKQIPKKNGWLLPISLEFGGLVLLYVNALMFDSLSLAAIVAAVFLIISGLYFHTTKAMTKTVPVMVTQGSSSEIKSYESILKNLELDRTEFLTQKETLRNDFKRFTELQVALTEELGQPYILDS